MVEKNAQFTGYMKETLNGDSYENAHKIMQAIKRISYLGWRFEVDSTGYGGYRLHISTVVPDSTDKSNRLLIGHHFPIPPYKMTQVMIFEWILEMIWLVHKHEAMEEFKVDGKAVFFPDHNIASNPYLMVYKED